MAKQAVNQGNYQDAFNYLLPLTNSTNEFIYSTVKFITDDNSKIVFSFHKYTRLSAIRTHNINGDRY
jgi:hypothetical protein